MRRGAEVTRAQVGGRAPARHEKGRWRQIKTGENLAIGTSKKTKALIICRGSVQRKIRIYMKEVITTRSTCHSTFEGTFYPRLYPDSCEIMPMCLLRKSVFDAPTECT